MFDVREIMDAPDGGGGDRNRMEYMSRRLEEGHCEASNFYIVIRMNVWLLYPI